MAFIPVIGKTDEGLDVVWVSPDKRFLITYGKALFMDGFNAYRRVGDTNMWEKPKPLVFHTSIKSALKLLYGIKGG